MLAPTSLFSNLLRNVPEKYCLDEIFGNHCIFSLFVLVLLSEDNMVNLTEEEIECVILEVTFCGKMPLNKGSVERILICDREKSSGHLKSLLEADEKQLAEINEIEKLRANNGSSTEISTIMVIRIAKLEARIELLKKIIG